MELPERVAGVVLVGGRSSRMGGGDKCLLPLAGRPLLARIIERLRPQAGDLVINANGEPSRLASFGLPVIADSIAGHAGPLAGVHAGLEWAKANVQGVRYVVTVAGDSPFFPTDLVQRFLAALAQDSSRICVARSEEGVHPVFGLWPVAIAGEIETSLRQGARRVSAWVAQHEAKEAFFPPVMIGGRPIDPFFNINRPEDLAEADALLGPQRTEAFKG
jgi:molybdopterin-guanine dinucleotide biosynthesis protein A